MHGSCFTHSGTTAEWKKWCPGGIENGKDNIESAVSIMTISA